MAVEKIIKVKLEGELGICEFPFEQAEAIMRLRNHGGWKLVDEKFEFDNEKNCIKRRRSKEGVQGA